jgi:hypothetical protein
MPRPRCRRDTACPAVGLLGLLGVLLSNGMLTQPWGFRWLPLIQAHTGALPSLTLPHRYSQKWVSCIMCYWVPRTAWPDETDMVCSLRLCFSASLRLCFSASLPLCVSASLPSLLLS